jgi:hypothetical protein
MRFLKAGVAHLVERQLPKLQVAGSSPVFRSELFTSEELFKYYNRLQEFYCSTFIIKPQYFFS